MVEPRSNRRVALYARVSTNETRQHAENQLRELRTYAAERGWKITSEYVDEESGAKGARQRAALERMLRDAAAGKFHIVLVWALDRLTREGVYRTFAYIERLRDSGVEFHSRTEEHFRTTGPAGEMLIAVSAWIAEQERIRHIERVRAGLDRARADGRTLGRPRLRVSGLQLSDMAQTKSYKAISQELGISPATISRRIAQHKAL